MTGGREPSWTTAAISATVRLAAEAGTEVDEALDHLGPGGTPAEVVADMVGRLEQSADLTEVATDLAALLWAEYEDVPRIATILDEPAAQAALEAVAEARRVAAGRLADGAASRPSAAPVTTGASSGPPPVAGPPTIPGAFATRQAPSVHCWTVETSANRMVIGRSAFDEVGEALRGDHQPVGRRLGVAPAGPVQLGPDEPVPEGHRDRGEPRVGGLAAGRH